MTGREILNSTEEQLQEVCKRIKFKKVLLEGNPAEEIVRLPKMKLSTLL